MPLHSTAIPSVTDAERLALDAALRHVVRADQHVAAAVAALPGVQQSVRWRSRIGDAVTFQLEVIAAELGRTALVVDDILLDLRVAAFHAPVIEHPRGIA